MNMRKFLVSALVLVVAALAFTACGSCATADDTAYAAGNEFYICISPTDDTLAANGPDFTRKYVARPGCSEHQTGLAIDLGKAAGKIDFIRPAFPHDGACGAFRRLAAQYGFIERYRREKESLTGIAEEPWHFRYVGAPHAQLMESHGLCLEEYTALLRQGPRSCPLLDGRLAQVFYIPCTGGRTQIRLPEGCCQISGDNVGGFIVTAWGDPA